ncbi:MAG: RNA polymerase sigma factor [Acidobacteriota bacterium]
MAEERDPWREPLQRGDGQAFRDFVREVGPSLRRYLETVVRSPAEAEELAQEAFLRLVQSLGGFRGECSVRSFLFRIAHNLALNHLASASARREEAGEVPDRPSADPSPQVRLLQEERSLHLRRLLSALPPQQRAVVALRTWEDLSFKEIAAVLGLAEGTAKAHYFFALRNLRRRLEEGRGP